MIRLCLSDVRRHAGVWAWVCVVSVVAGASVAAQMMVLEGSLASARAAADPAVRSEMISGAQAVSSTCLTAIVLAAATVLSTSVGSVIRARSRDFGLWRALGMAPGALRAVLLAQMAVVGAVGAAAGSVVAWPVARGLLPLVVKLGVALPGTEPGWSAAAGWIVVSVVAASVVLGGWGAVRRASRATEMELLAGRVSRRRWAPGRVIAALVRVAVLAGCAAGVGGALGAAGDPGRDLDARMEAAFLACFGVLTAVCLLARWVVPGMLWLAARLPVPSVAWQVATASASRQSRRSSATVLPFLVAIGLVAVMYGIRAIGIGNMNTAAFVTMFGLAFATAWTGGVAAIAMAGSERRHDGALLQAAGASVGAVVAVEVLEGALHAIAAVLLGCVVSVGTGYLLAGAAGRDPWQVIAAGPWLELAIVGAMTLATTTAAVLLSTRLRSRASLPELLHARD